MDEWKSRQRTALLEARAKLSNQQRNLIQKSVLKQLSHYLEKLPPQTLGIYWPIKGELDCRPLANLLIEAGWILTLPVINTASKQLDFAQWTPETEMIEGRWSIPVPSRPFWLKPSLFLIPLVGFDKQNFRLGYGGGFYDRTLADVSKPITTVGVGMEIGRLENIYPHKYDIPMDIILTEAGLHQCPNT